MNSFYLSKYPLDIGHVFLYNRVYYFSKIASFQQHVFSLLFIFQDLHTDDLSASFTHLYGIQTPNSFVIRIYHFPAYSIQFPLTI